MKMFMIEWFDKDACQVRQEYFLSAHRAFSRYLMLEKDVPESIPEIETKFLDSYEEPFV